MAYDWLRLDEAPTTDCPECGYTPCVCEVLMDAKDDADHGWGVDEDLLEDDEADAPEDARQALGAYRRRTWRQDEAE